ncbi:MAG: DNA polymerase, partial [Armatimonadetes bacterium]|nr:DNA polymerase [Armatimonadota bacterium]
AAVARISLAGARWQPLAGSGYAWLAEFANWEEFRRGRQLLGAEGIDHFTYGDPVRQYLVRTGRTLFKGLGFSDLRRMQVDIETTTLSPDDPDARIILAAVGDGSKAEIIEGEEREILLGLTEVVRARDPDVIEGHNIFGFDLPYLAARADRAKVELHWGRDGSSVRFGAKRRCAIGGTTRPFVPAYVRGRHVIDTMFGVQRYDAQAAEMESYGLKEASEHLGISAPQRVFVDQTNMRGEWAKNAARVREYARQDVMETARLAEHVMQTDFYVTQIVPETYQSVAVSGTGEKINSLLVREYLRQDIALPLPGPSRPFSGGHVEVRTVGVVEPVVKVDVESLYPSIMLTEGIAPASDTLGIFLPMLRELTKRRLAAKARARAADGPDRRQWEGVQSSLKVLINSFYGYLGTGSLFNDYEAAERVTRRGRELVLAIADRIEETGGQVIEIDTDGVYLRPPEGVRDEGAELSYVEEIGAILPKGINLQHDGRYRAMLSLKQKNYVCVGYDGRKVFRGAALRSRADEPFGRELLAEAVDYLLAGRVEALSTRYHELLQLVLAGEMPIEKLARRERITEKTYSSPARKRLAGAAAGAVVGDIVWVYERADGTLARKEDYDDDADSGYYAERLYRFIARLREAIGPDFERLFPPPSSQVLRQATAGQTEFEFE